MHRSASAFFRATILSFALLMLIVSTACGRGGRMIGHEYAYVSAPQVNLRDRLSAVYTKVGVVKNGDRVQVLEKSKRFYRVRTEGGAEGWLETRYLAGQDVYDGFQKLMQENESTPAQAHGAARLDLNIHLTPSRDGEHLYQMKEGEKVEVLKRAVSEKSQAANPVKASPKAAQKSAKPQPQVQVKDTVTKALTAKPEAAEVPKVYEDWRLVRDSQKRVGWVLARMIDIDVPMDIAQYAEGQRIVANFVLNTVNDTDPDTGQAKSVPQYLVLTTEPKDGQPFDFNHIRVFSWNQKRHRYETAYRERDLFGVFPVTVGHEVFGKEGDLPTFTLHVKTADGNTIEKKYKMNGPIVRRVMTPAEELADKQDRAQRAAQRRAERAAHPARAKGKRR
jgi:SH3-like domain-containing protein